MKPLVLAVDVGTTNWKLGVFEYGQMTTLLRQPALTQLDGWGGQSIQPKDLWQALGEMVWKLPGQERAAVRCIALTGMADEGGLLIRKADGAPGTPLFPWNHPLGQEAWKQQPEPEQYEVTGLPTAAKYGMYKLLALKAQMPLEDFLWLGAPGFLAYRMTEKWVTDPSLGARIGLMNLNQRRWDTERMARVGLPESVLPNVRPSGEMAGQLSGLAAEGLGLSPGIPVAVCGHDHLLAAYGQDALGENSVYSSMGTAQVLLGPESPPFAKAMTNKGLSYGPGIEAGELTWLGSIQAAGGSLSAWRKWLGIQDDAALWKMLSQREEKPTGMLYFPFLLGRGAPHMNGAMRGALVGLGQGAEHQDILYAVLEGICMETRAILETNRFPKQLIVSGGLTRQDLYLQIMADVLGLPVRRSGTSEATLFGAARLAAKRCLAQEWAYPGLAGETFVPDSKRNQRYDLLYRQGYQRLLEPLRAFASLA